MAKMGYIAGTGLGKNSEGRVEPVEAEVLPEGNIGLDGVMELREKKLLKKLSKRKSKKSIEPESFEVPEMNVFDFINTKLSAKSKYYC